MKMKKFWFTVDDLKPGYLRKECMSLQEEKDGFVSKGVNTVLIKDGTKYTLPNYYKDLKSKYNRIIVNLKKEKLIEVFGTDDLDSLI